MKRVSVKARPDFKKQLEDAGCYYHTIDGEPYWTEDAAYEFTAKEIDVIDDATMELHALCMEHVQGEIERGDYIDYPVIANVPQIKELIQRSWDEYHIHVFGRFDLGFRNGQVKMYEYNADTPTSLPEAAIWQWQWLQDKNHLYDQFNSIHEKLVHQWKMFPKDQMIYFTMMQDANYEDAGNLSYLMETALEAGYNASLIDIEQIGWKEGSNHFVDLADRKIETCFKLYPWEWMLNDEFGWQTLKSETRFIEPAWKMLLSTKALLPALWRKFPKHPNLLEAYTESKIDLYELRVTDWIRKPMLGREGINIGLYHPRDADRCEMPLDMHPLYNQQDYVLQEMFELPKFGDKYAVIGSWVVGNNPCGIGIREDTSFVTKNTSRFVPHYFVE